MNKKIYLIFPALMLIAQFLLTPANAESVTLNLKGADINAVIGTVADITNKNFIVDPRVKGKVTIISSRPMDEKEIYQVFLSVLEVHGFTAVPIGNIIKILPDADAKHSAIPALPEGRTGKGDEAVTRVIEIEHVTAAQLVPILRPLVPPQGHLAAYPASNMLIISDRAANINRLVEIINRIDQPTSGEIEFVQLQYASAADIVRVLNSMQQQRKKNAKSQSPILVADDRTNSILIGGEKARRLQLRAIIAHLDTPSDNVGDTHVIYLRYAKATELLPVLTGVEQTISKVGIATSGSGPGARVGGRIGGTARAAARAGGRGAALARKSTTSIKQNSLFSIQADESTNALVITASPGIFKSLQQVINKLDVRRAQVMVEAIIAEVSMGTKADLGVEWVAFDKSGGNSPVASTNFNSGLSSLITAAAGGAATSASLPLGALLGVGRKSDSGLSFAGLLTALKSDGSTNVLSTPNLVTLDNEEAEMFVGQEVSIPSGSFTTAANSSTNPFTTFNRQKIGLKLRIKPQISAGDAIKLEIDQSIEGIIAGTAGTENLQTSERSVNTTVMVDDGRVLVLSGLIKDDVLETESKVPFLGDIPVLGALFRSTSVEKTKINLMIFMKPTILRDAKKGLALTRSKYDYIREKQLMIMDRGVSFLPEDQLPMLKEFDQYVELPPPFAEDDNESIPPGSGVLPPDTESSETAFPIEAE